MHEIKMYFYRRYMPFGFPALPQLLHFQHQVNFKLVTLIIEVLICHNTCNLVLNILFLFETVWLMNMFNTFFFIWKKIYVSKTQSEFSGIVNLYRWWIKDWEWLFALSVMHINENIGMQRKYILFSSPKWTMWTCTRNRTMQSSQTHVLFRCQCRHV